MAGDASDIVVSAELQPVIDHADPPSDGSRVDLMTLGPDAISIQGDEFVVSLDPSSVPPSHIDRDGLVSLSIGFTDLTTGEVAHQITSARAVTSGTTALSSTGSWVDPLAEYRESTSRSALPTLTGTGVASSASAAHGRVAGVLGAPVEPISVELEAERGATKRIQSASRMTAASGGECYWADTKRLWATVGTSYPIGKSRLSYSSSTSSSFGAGVTYGNGWSASGSKTTEDSWGQNFKKSGAKRSYQVQVDYRRQNCYLASQGTYSHSHTIPQRQPGFTRSNALGSAPNFRKCGKIASGEWWRGKVRGTDYQLSYGVKAAKFIGIDLSSRRAYSSDSRLSYYYGKKRRMCGSNDVPSEARTMRERHR